MLEIPAFRARPAEETTPRRDGAAPRRRSVYAPAAAIALTLTALALGACNRAGEPQRAVLDESDIGLTVLTQPPRPPELVARRDGEIRDVVDAVSPERLSNLSQLNGRVRRQGPQIPFFFESEIGRAFLRSGEGRAVAFGWPQDRCPAFGVALDRATTQDAAAEALGQCLRVGAEGAARRGPAEAECGCRLTAAGQVLLAPLDVFAYARAVTARLIALDARDRVLWNVPLIAEERAPQDRPLTAEEQSAIALGARRLWLLSPGGPVGALALDPGGGAELTLLKGPRDALEPIESYRGRWSSEGYRRGRLAEQIAVGADGAERYVLLVGYEPAELSARETELIDAAQELLADG